MHLCPKNIINFIVIIRAITSKLKCYIYIKQKTVFTNITFIAKLCNKKLLFKSLSAITAIMIDIFDLHILYLVLYLKMKL